MSNPELTPEQITTMINMLRAMLPAEDAKAVNTDVAPTKKYSIKNETKNKQEKVSTKNKFVDMIEMDMHKEDVIIDQKLAKHPPTLRSRAFRLISVICRICGKKEEINPTLLHDSIDRYKCNKCCSSAG